MNWTKTIIKKKRKIRIRNKVCGLKIYKIKKQKILKAITPPQWQGYRYVKESRSTRGGDSFWGFEKRIMKCVILKNKWDKKRGDMVKEEYIWDETAKKWVPKMKVWPCEDQLIHGSRTRVKDSQDAVTRECAKIHVLIVDCVCEKLDRTFNCGTRYKIIVNVEKQEKRIVIYCLRRKIFKIVKQSRCHIKKEVFLIGLKVYWFCKKLDRTLDCGTRHKTRVNAEKQEKRIVVYRLKRKIFKIVKQSRCHSKSEVFIIKENRESRRLAQNSTDNIGKISKYLWWYYNMVVLIIGEIKVIYGNMREMGWTENGYSVIMINFMSFYRENMVLTFFIKLKKWYIHYGRIIKDCNFLSEKISYQYSKKRKRRSRASGRKRLLHEGNKGEIVKWQLWGILLYIND
jgi:hypothetical protein